MWEAVLTGGGVGGVILSVAYAYRQWQDARRERQQAPQQARSSAVTDAATANSLLLASLDAERQATQRLAERVQDLETQNAMLYERMRDQRREYEAEIETLRHQLDEVSRRLSDMQTRIARDDAGET